VIIAIDGPAGSGKSSTARAVARELGFRHLDSGAFYRALTWAALQRGIAVTRWDALQPDEIEDLGVTAAPARGGFTLRVGGADVSSEIRSADVNAHVSAMARVPAVRNWLLERLRAAARESDIVVDGRDIGTVVFPEAELKVFLVADTQERARRRLRQMELPDDEQALAAEVRRIEDRDRMDSTREIAPLRAARDARRLDTTGLTFEEQVRTITAWARPHGQSAPQATTD
jgi:CMP/dCMP kinase